MASGNWFAFGHPTVKEGALGQLENLGDGILEAASGGGTSGLLNGQGSVYLFNSSQAATLTADGFKGYNSEALAIANPNPQLSEAQVKQFLAVGMPTKSATSTALSNAQNTVGALNPVKWILSLSGISGTNLVLRGLKVIIGGTLLLVGIVHMAGIDSGKIAQIASKVPIPV
jgi:hypothetical protein